MSFYTDYLTALERCREQAAADIREKAVSNPNVNHLGKGCFTVKLSEIAKHNGVLDPFYYDFDAQYEFLEGKARTQSPETFINTLEQVRRTGKLGDKRFHPDVIESLSGI